MTLRETEAAMFAGVLGVFALVCVASVALSYEWIASFCWLIAGALTGMIATERLSREYWRKMAERMDYENQIMRRWIMGWITEAEAAKELDALRRKF